MLYIVFIILTSCLCRSKALFIMDLKTVAAEQKYRICYLLYHQLFISFTEIVSMLRTYRVWCFDVDVDNNSEID